MVRQGVYITARKLMDTASGILRGFGFNDEDARIAAKVLVDTDARGVSSHGVVALPNYMQQVKKGGIDPKAKIKVISENGSVCLMDGCNALGQLSGVKATMRAIELAQKFGSSVVSVKNGSHYGAGAYYAMMCAENDMIGIAISNSTPVIGVPGSKGPAIGNNPISIAAPTAGGPPIVLDMALSIVAVGKMMNMYKEGKEIPDGWVFDSEGMPSKDPNDLDNGGSASAFGGYKGYGIAVMAEILSSILPGAGVTEQLMDWILYPEKPSRLGYFIMAIDISKVRDAREFKKDVNSFVDGLHNRPKAAGTDRLLVPGEIENDTMRKSEQEGIWIPDHAFTRLVNLAKEVGVEVDNISSKGD
ncbi:MAG: putative oxidoreductase YjmC [Firmicutes bacterium ADurb.Bin153]|nr:MAG: putative oxidoreductase YjmC [Firmicutes bacterium ADurb.Bin153]